MWNEKGASIKIYIPSPPWKTWWAYVLYSLLTIGLLSFVSWLYYRRIVADNDRLSALRIATAKEQLFANVSH